MHHSKIYATIGVAALAAGCITAVSALGSRSEGNSLCIK